MGEEGNTSLVRQLREPCDVYSSSTLAVHHGFGFGSNQRNNVHVLRDGMVLTTAGSAAILIDTEHPESAEYIFSPDESGIGCLRVHPSKRYFAIGGKGNKPNVYIYQYPERSLYKVLRNGTEKKYAAMSFSADGSKLATVGGAPDFMLTIWDWAEEKIILRNKAFSQEVYNVSFNPRNDGLLVTSGLGHIRFWKMATTFTGLKLQGDIGKFGKVELSDVEAYASMPDGKVLSGSESGSLLLWDGNFIKLEVRRQGDRLPHQGQVTVCHLLNGDKPSVAEFLTAGEDGWMRWWSMEKIDQAEIDDENPFFMLEPSREVFLDGIHPVTVQFGEGFVIVQDKSGSIWKIEEPILSNSERKCVWTGHAGAVSSLATSPVDHFAASTGTDGSVRLWDYVGRHEVYHSRFSSPATCAVWAPTSVDIQGRTILAGFADGVVRVLVRTKREWKLVDVFKPHNSSVKSMSFSPGGDKLVTCADDGSVFIFELMLQAQGLHKFHPKGFIFTNNGANKVIWTSQGEKILIACNSGSVLQVTLPHPSNNVKYSDTKATFELSGLPTRSYHFKRKLPKRRVKETDEQPRNDDGDDKEEDENLKRALEEEEAAYQVEKARIESLPVGNVLDIALSVDDPSKFILTLDGADAGPLYVCSFEFEYPLETLANIPLDDGRNSEDPEDLRFSPGLKLFRPVTTMCFSWSGKLFLNGCEDGALRVRPSSSLQTYAMLNAHDGFTGAVTGACASFDDNFVLSTSRDGTVFVHKLQLDALVSSCQDLAKKPAVRIKRRKVQEELYRPLFPAFYGQSALASGGALGSPSSPKSPSTRSSLVVGEIGNDMCRAPLEVIDDNIAADQGFALLPPAVVSSAHDETAESKLPKATDILDADAYSIQDDKLKTEEDTKRKLAEIEKDKVRKVIAQLREDFESLLRQNEGDSEETRLARSEFNIDDELIESLHLEGKQMLEEVIKETQWDVNMSKVKLSKLKSVFLDILMVDDVTLHGFNQMHCVQSFRTAKFSEALEEAAAAMHDMLNEESHGNNGDMAYNSGASGSTSDGFKGNDVPGGLSSGRAAKSGPKSGEKDSGWEARKILRRQRKAQMQELLDQKPDENADDPADVAAINWVMSNMGDYKLKSADDYQVPAHMQVNADKKRRQSILLAESIQGIRMSFNAKFLALRELKKRLVETAREDAARIHEINELLGEKQREELGLPLQLDPKEWPEKRLEFSEAELNDFLLGNGAQELVPETLPSSSPIHPTPPGAITHPDAETTELPTVLSEEHPIERFQQSILVNAQKGAETRYEQEVWDTTRKLLLHEKAQILDKNIAAIQAFDSAVYDLRKERAQLQAELTAAELRQVLLARELLLLNEFERKDVALTKKLESCRAQKAEVVAEITLCQEKLSAKKAEIEVWQEKDRIIMDEFNSIVSSQSNVVNAQLLKIFKRKIKRTKQREDGSDDEGDSEDESEDDYDDEEEELEDGEPEEERCPDGCDPAVYDKVLELREKRLDQEEILNEFNKAVEELKKACDRHQGREKQIDKDLKSTAVEIQAFQNEKQRKLNEIDSSIVLKLDQIACLEEPEDSDDQNNNNHGDDLGDFEEDGFAQDHEVDCEDPEIETAKVELANVEEQLEATEGMEDEEDAIVQQEELLSQVQRLKQFIWKRRGMALKRKAQLMRLVLPSTIENSLVFDQDALFELHAGIGKLMEENKAKKKEYKGLHHTQKNLVRERKQKEADIMVLQDKCEDLQMLKFGQLIDLDTIEKMGSNKSSTDIKSKYMEHEKAHRDEYAQVKSQISTAEAELLQVTKENSALLQEIASLTEVQRRLELELNASGSAIARKAGTVQSHKEIQETQRLKQLVRMQNQEIDALKKEISVLRGSNPRANQNQVIE